MQKDSCHPKVPGPWQMLHRLSIFVCWTNHPCQHLPPSEHAHCILQKGKGEEIGVAFAVGNSWRIVKGSQVAGLTFTPVQEASPEPGRSHYRRLLPPVISRLHLATPGVPSSITGHCLVSTPPSPPPPARQGSLLISQFVHILKTI